jgi:hypothetical protein
VRKRERVEREGGEGKKRERERERERESWGLGSGLPVAQNELLPYPCPQEVPTAAWIQCGLTVCAQNQAGTGPAPLRSYSVRSQFDLRCGSYHPGHVGALQHRSPTDRRPYVAHPLLVHLRPPAI